MNAVKVKLNGEDHELLFDWNSISEYEDQFGMSILFTLQKKTLGFNVIRGLYWAALLHENPNLKLWEVGNLLGESKKKEGYTHSEIAEPVFKALDKSGLLPLKLTKKEDKKGTKEPKKS